MVFFTMVAAENHLQNNMTDSDGEKLMPEGNGMLEYQCSHLIFIFVLIAFVIVSLMFLALFSLLKLMEINPRLCNSQYCLHFLGVDHSSHSACLLHDDRVSPDRLVHLFGHHFLHCDPSLRKADQENDSKTSLPVLLLYVQEHLHSRHLRVRLHPHDGHLLCLYHPF